MKGKTVIIIQDHLDEKWKDWFEDMEINYDGDNTIITGNLKEESHMHEILNPWVHIQIQRNYTRARSELTVPDWGISDSCGRTYIRLLNQPFFFSNSMIQITKKSRRVFSCIFNLSWAIALNSLRNGCL